MAVIQMPSRGGKDETGMITTWYKKTGDWVAQGDELFSFDTDEDTYTVKSQKAGRLVAIFVPEGELVHCPADVGMLATPTPDSVLKMGRQQYIDETKPLSAREPASGAAEEEPAASEEVQPAQTEAASTGNAADETAIKEEIPAPEDELIEEELPAKEEEPMLEEASEEDLDLAVLEDALREELEKENISELMQLDEPSEELPEEESSSEEVEAEAPAEEPATEETFPEEPGEEETFKEESPEEEPVEEAEKAPAAQPVHPASVTAQVDLTCCTDIADRTGVKLAAMVRFAAMHTALAEHLDALEANSLRTLDALQVLPNVYDLTTTGVTAVTAGGEGMLRLLVPAPHQAVRVQDDALELYPCLNLTLAFDESAPSLADAAKALQETCAHLENLLALLI